MAWDISGATNSLNTLGKDVQSALRALTSNDDPAKAAGLAAALTAQTELMKITSEGITNALKTLGDSTAKIAAR